MYNRPLFSARFRRVFSINETVLPPLEQGRAGPEGEGFAECA